MLNLKSGLALATTAAALFAGAGFTTLVQAADDGMVKCAGVNSCKGTSDCKTAKSECKGQNSCKGQGYVLLPKAECDAAKAKMKEGKE